MIDKFESFEESTEYCQSALASMSDLKVPANPVNYTVWYAHCSGKYPDLSNMLDNLRTSDEGFSPNSIYEIFDRFFGSENELNEIRDTGGQLQTTLEQVLQVVAAAGAETSTYGNKLVDVTDTLTGEPSVQNTGKIVQVILAETQKMVEKSQTLEESLQESARQVEKLRDHLEQVREESRTDALTGIGNRKCFEVRMAEAIENALRENEPLCLLMCDIDHFKRFNDTYGHRVGDEVLKIVGHHLKEGVKGRDSVARYGGEEFAIILPQTDLHGAASLANALREKLASKQLQDRKTGDTFGRITLSIGAALFRAAEPAGEMIERADRVLYFAKRNGRNRVETEVSLPLNPSRP